MRISISVHSLSAFAVLVLAVCDCYQIHMLSFISQVVRGTCKVRSAHKLMTSSFNISLSHNYVVFSFATISLSLLFFIHVVAP